MKLEVGMYVRTNEGIGTVQRIYNNKNDCTVRFKKGHVKKWVTIFKASHNIIDLIEEGDIITLGKNNYPLQIINKWEHGGDIHIELSNRAKFEDLHYNNEFKIYSIVTKQQFEAMKYRIGE